MGTLRCASGAHSFQTQTERRLALQPPIVAKAAASPSMFIDLNQIVLSIRYVLKNRSVVFSTAILLLSFLFAFCVPFSFLYFVVASIASVMLLRFVLKPVGEIQMGVSVSRPIAAFKIRDQYFKIGLLPFGVFINGYESLKCELLSCLIVLALSLCLSTLAFWVDGWPDLQAAQSTITAGTTNTEVAWKDKVKSTGLLKVIGVDENSIASKMGLKYGDIIVAVNNVPGPTVSSLSNSIINSDRVDLQILDKDGLKNITLERDSKVRKKLFFGFSVGLSLHFRPEMLVQAVQVNGEGFELGIKPGDLLGAPQTAYLSNGLLSSGWRDRKIDSIAVIRSTTSDNNVVTRSVFKQIPTSELTDQWTDSLILLDRYEQYRPTLLESLQVSLASFLLRFPLLPQRGSHFDVLASGIHVVGFSPLGGFVKQFSFLSAFLAFLFFMSSLCRRLFARGFWFPSIVLVLLTVGQEYARVSIFDSFIKNFISLMPLADSLLVLHV